MKIVFIGTGTSVGVPMPGCSCQVCKSPDVRDKRMRPSVYVEINSINILIDATPDLREQMLRYNITRVDYLLLTHPHRDHVAGIDDLRAINAFYRSPIPIYASELTCNAIRRMFFYCFENPRYPGVPAIELHVINNAPFCVGGVEILPVLCYHHQMPVFGFRIGDFTYITDASYIPENELDKIKGTRILVINALRRKPHIAHFTLYEALALIKRVSPARAYLTHISHQMGLHVDILRECPPGVEPAWDGLTIYLNS